MIAHEVRDRFKQDVIDGFSLKEASASVAELAKEIKPYKRYGAMRTTAYVFWDGSAFVAGEQGDFILFTQGDSYAELDKFAIVGTWD